MKILRENKSFRALAISAFFNKLGSSMYNLVFVSFAATMPNNKYRNKGWWDKIKKEVVDFTGIRSIYFVHISWIIDSDYNLVGIFYNMFN